MGVWGEGQFPLGILGLKNSGPYHPLRLRGSPLGSGSSSCPDDPKESLDQISALPWRRGRDAASMVGGSCEVGAGCLGDDGSPGADRAQSLVLCRMWKFRNSSPGDEDIQGTGKLDGSSQEVSFNFFSTEKH